MEAFWATRASSEISLGERVWREVTELETEHLRGFPFFDGLMEQDMRLLADVACTRRLAKHGMIWCDQEREGALYLIHQGRVKRCLVGENGREVIMDVHRAGDFFGETSLVNGGDSPAFFTALEHTELVVLRRRDLFYLVQRTSQVASRLLMAVLVRLKEADRQIMSLTLWDAPRRVVRILLDLMGQRGIPMPPGILIRNRPTHQELAGMAGMTRETVCRVLRALQREGYLSYRGREITILREQDLRRDFLDELPMSGDGSDQALDHVMVNAV